MQRTTCNETIFKTSDDVQLSYISAGKGQLLVMIPDWSQSAEQFKYQIPVFAEQYHVIAIDPLPRRSRQPCHVNWRDQVVRIRQPTLIVSGRKSIIP
jgi:pimeloyl-ACP methyl ester carboxylesterase